MIGVDPEGTPFQVVAEVLDGEVTTLASLKSRAENSAKHQQKSESIEYANVQYNPLNTHRSIYSHDRTWRLPHVAATAHARIMGRGATTL